jgi:uncharacterized membrane protein
MAKKVGLGNRIAPPRFIVFMLLVVAGVPLASAFLGWRHGLLAGFDAAALVFLASIAPIVSLHDADSIRTHGRENEANRAVIVGIAVAVMVVILVAVAVELSGKSAPDTGTVGLVIATVALAWVFGNVVFALHYAHVYYTPRPGGGDEGGLAFPGTAEPDYWDFLYFAFTLGMCFQTSDVPIRSGRLRRVATLHGAAAFVFNIGVLAFTINVLGNYSPAGP